jgi:single-stranded-DNA-specific exonuclease
MKEYITRPIIPEAARIGLAGQPALLQKLLFYRGIETPESAEEFLNPSYETGLHDPYLIKDMEKAVRRISQAMSGGEKILIYTDYDADGIPAAVVLNDFFKKVGYEKVAVYIPHRHTEGYGLNHDAIKKFKDDGVALIITLDCGIADIAEVDFANALGIDTIITDHHLPVGDRLPKAYAILNSKQDGCVYPFSSLCGAGVAFKLVQALLKDHRGTRSTRHDIKRNDSKIDNKESASKSDNHNDSAKDGWEKWLLDMVGLATLSDMVPLQGENRVLAHYGLKVLRKSPRPGLRKLLAKAGINQKNLVEDDIGFMVTPRINAASRMGDPIEAYKLLSTDDEVVGGQLADYLESINTERKNLVAVITREAKKMVVQKYGDGDSVGGTRIGVGVVGICAGNSSASNSTASNPGETMPPVLVIGNPLWRPAVLGLVANSLVALYGRPVFMWGRENGQGIKGSCRSDGSVNLVELMERANARVSTSGQTGQNDQADQTDKTTKTNQGIFSEYGGHALSGGFAVRPEDIHGLEAAIVMAYETMMKEKKLEASKNPKSSQDAGVATNPETVFIDAELTIDDVNDQTHVILEKLAPFGTGNPKPLFIFRRLTPFGVKQFGKADAHLELSFKNSKGRPVRAIGFFMKPEDFRPLLRPDWAVGTTAIAGAIGTNGARGNHESAEAGPYPTIDLVATMEKSYFRDRPELRLRIVDIV